MIKAVIFDFGNVISLPHEDFQQWSKKREKETGVDAKVFLESYTNRRQEFDRGTINGSQLYESILRDLGYNEQADNKELVQKLALSDLADWNNVNPKTTEWGLSLQQKGLKIGILSNMPHEFLKLYHDQIPLFAKADFALFSCNVKMIKPEPEIYRKCLEGTGLKPDEVVFFDDIQINIDAAKKEGWNAFVFTTVEQAQKDLDSLF